MKKASVNIIAKERHYDLDWLRVLAVLLLVPFHVALIFVLDPNSIMYIKDVLTLPRWLKPRELCICGTCLCCLSSRALRPISRWAFVQREYI